MTMHVFFRTAKMEVHDAEEHTLEVDDVMNNAHAAAVTFRDEEMKLYHSLKVQDGAILPLSVLFYFSISTSSQVK